MSSITYFDAITENIAEKKIIDIKLTINSITEENMISFLEKPRILKTRFWKVLIFPCTRIALDITTRPMIMVMVEIIPIAIKT